MKGKKQSYFWRKMRIIMGVLLALCLIGIALFFFINHTKKTRVSLQVSTPTQITFTDDNFVDFTGNSGTPDINNNRTLSDVQPLVVSYKWESGDYAPTFKMDLTGADIAKNIKMTPYIRGHWSRVTPDTIRFIPESDWPADTRFTVKIAHKLFNDDIQPDTRNISFTTSKIAATINSFNTYPDKAHKQNIIGVAVVSFNYPIDTKGFDNRVTIKRGLHRIPFSVRFDRFNRTAIITTEPIVVDDSTHTLRIKINRISAATSNTSTKKVNASTTIESADNFFKISGLQSIAADDVRGNAQQLILVDMTTAVADKTNWSSFIDAFLLPKYITDDDEEPHEWATDEVSENVLKQSKKLTLKPTEFANPIGVYQYAFAYDVSDTTPRYLYVRVRQGIESNAGFVLKNGVSRVVPVAYPEKTARAQQRLGRRVHKTDGGAAAFR